MSLETIFWSLLQLLVFLAIAPLMLGVLRYSRARLQGRRGPQIIQPYLDLLKLRPRKPVVPDPASWIFRASPYLIWTCYALLGLVLPAFYLTVKAGSAGGQDFSATVITGPASDLLVIIYVLGLSRFILGLASMDSGAPFGWLGGSREMYMQVLAEPALIVAVYAMLINTKTTSFSGILVFNRKLVLDLFRSTDSSLTSGRLLIFVANALILLALTLIALAEAGRLPFDNQSTHLELTMMGKAVRLEYSGRHLALLEYAEGLRLTFFLTIIVNFTLPFMLASGDLALELNILFILLYPVKLGLCVFILAFWESIKARLRLRLIPNLALWSLFFSLIAILVVVFNLEAPG